MKFLKENVFPHKSEICFYLRKELPIYDASKTTPLEVHYNGIKQSPISPKHHHSLVRATKQPCKHGQSWRCISAYVFSCVVM